MLNKIFNKYKKHKDHLFQIPDGFQCNLKEKSSLEGRLLF